MQPFAEVARAQPARAARAVQWHPLHYKGLQLLPF